MKTSKVSILKYKLSDIRGLVKNGFGELKAELRETCASSGDYTYKRRFILKYLPELYEKHVKDEQANCVFCTRLVRSACHLHCLKCSAGTYIHCSPLLPGIFQSGERHDRSPGNIERPWFFKNPCDNFKRLEKREYNRNLKVPLSWITIYNYEVLEGLQEGLCSSRRPCYVCASVDYEIYKKCMGQSGFNVLAPCPRIAFEIASSYQ